MRPEKYDIMGGKVVVIGDLHLSSSFRGSHKSYIYECYKNLDTIKEIVAKEKASAVVFLGDIVGVTERAIKDRQFLTRVIAFFLSLNELTKGNVYAVKGNHDAGEQSDFDMLIGIGCLKNPMYLDYYGKRDGEKECDGLEVRFHLVNYGDENKKLPLTTDDNPASDVVFGHCDYYIEGVTNWYSKGNGVEVSNLKNFNGVSLIVSGHIHEPSDEVLYTTLSNGEPVGLFYPGAPGRVKERYDDCWYLVFQYGEDDDDSWSTNYDAHFFGLEPASEVYFENEEILGTEENDEKLEAARRSESLTAIVKEIMESRLTSGDLYAQIDIIPNATKEAKTLAKKYLERATLAG